MKDRASRRVSPGIALGAIALLVALAGTATAAEWEASSRRTASRQTPLPQRARRRCVAEGVREVFEGHGVCAG